MHPRIENWKTDFVEGIMEDHGLTSPWYACWIKAYNEISAQVTQKCTTLRNLHFRAFGDLSGGRKWDFYAVEDGKRFYFWEFKPSWRVGVCNRGDIQVEVPVGSSLEAAWAAWTAYLGHLGVEAGECPQKTPIIDFYTGGKHPRGFTFEEGLAQTNEDWEKAHDLIQWYFPLPEPSKRQPSAPVAVEDDFKAIQLSSAMRERMEKAVERFERFLMEYDGWRRGHDHNHLRITRVIRYLVLLDRPGRARLFFDRASILACGRANLESLDYWRDALTSKAPWDKQEET